MSAQSGKFDISSPNTFESFDRELTTHIGMHCDGIIIAAIRDERIDYSLSECVFDSDYTMVGGGKAYKGVVMPKGLKYNAFRAMYPLKAKSQREMLEDKKKLDRYTAEVAKAIVIIEDKLTRNTITHFENNKVYRKARDSQDMIALIRELRRVGPVGTISSGAALVNWQSHVSKPENTRYALAEGCSGDLNEFSNRWRGLHTTINSFDQAHTLNEMDFVKGAMRALPDNDALLSPIKANNLARPNFATLNDTLTYLHDTVTEANRDVGRCCESASLAGVKRKQPDEGSGPQVDNQDANPNPSDASVEILKILKTLQKQAPNKKECRRYLKTGVCTWEKDKDTPCRFLHLGKNSKTAEGVITKTQQESKKVKVVTPT